MLSTDEDLKKALKAFKKRIKLTRLDDETPELRLQCVATGIDRIEAIVFTHAHADHIMGLDDVRRFNHAKGGPLDVWADTRTHRVLQRCFGYAFQEPSPQATVFRPH